jgi:hypothetical protein
MSRYSASAKSDGTLSRRTPDHGFFTGKHIQTSPSTSAKGDTSFLGIDIGASSVKIVQLRASRGIAVLETYGEISLGPYGNQPIGKSVKLPPEKTAEAITDLMKEANITARTGGVSIPFSGSLVSGWICLTLTKSNSNASFL